ncbi:TraX family protein [Anaerofilum hominis]|nr:TraX family protein [Anaerofilum hominis]
MEQELQMMRAPQKRRAGLTGFDLKVIALVLMVLDHIHYFFEFTGAVPLIFNQLGRLSAGLFLFSVVEGFVHTHNRKKYFLRIYLISLAMGLTLYGMLVFGVARGDGMVPLNQIMANFVVLLPMLQGCEWLGQRRWVRGLAALLLPMAWPYLVLYLLCSLFPVLNGWVALVGFTVLPMHNLVMDGGTWYVLSGLLLYLLRKNRFLQAGGYFVFNLLVYGGMALSVPGITAAEFFNTYFEWMCAFSALFMVFYNGERGKNIKSFFYVFYPAHVYVLFGLSCLVWDWLH